MRIIFQDRDYTMSVFRARLGMLESQRDQLTERFFQRSVLRDTSGLRATENARPDIARLSEL